MTVRDDDWLSQVATGMAGSGLVVRPAPPGALEVSEVAGEAFDPPVRFEITEASVIAHLDIIATDALDLFPDVAPRRAAFQLLLTHLDETFVTKVVPGSRVWFADGRLHVDPVRTHAALPDLGTARDELYWTAANPLG